MSDSTLCDFVVRSRVTLNSTVYSLNAVYTYINDNQKHPTVLLIAGSGPSDFDGTICSLKPLEDIANGLARNGINSLRVDKRTLNYTALFEMSYGIEEEYLIDCREAIIYIKSQPSAGDIYLLGHSFGGQIACILAKEDDTIKGIIIFNSTARNLAELACDQYIKADSTNTQSYIAYRDAAISSTYDNAKGYYYFGATDFYWASVNKINTVQNIIQANKPTLIINSNNDKQCFDTDIKLWESSFSEKSNTLIVVDEKISHFGYEIDTNEPSVFLKKAKFPDRIIKIFSDFVYTAK